MITYLKRLAQIGINPKPHSGEDTFAALEEMSVELDRFDPRDFSPDVRAELVLVRGRIRRMAQRKTYRGSDASQALIDLLPLLDGYLGVDSRHSVHPLSFLSNGDLRTIVQRDYAELKRKLYPSEAWKSTVIAAGSILEAILFDVLANPKVHLKALSASRAPKRKGILIPFDEWKLSSLIEVAEELGLLPSDRTKSIDQVLRDYRNFVHPKKEIKAKYACDENEAMMAVGALGAVCDHFENNFTP